MPENVQTGAQPSVASLVGGLIEDTQRLIRQEVALARREVQDEWDKTKTAAALFGSAAVVCGLGAVCLCFFLVYLLNLALPLWASFLIIGVAITAIGGALLYAGIQKINDIHLVPPQTAETLRDDVRAVTAAVSAPPPAGGAYARR